MQTVTLSSTSKSKIGLIIQLAKELGVKTSQPKKKSKRTVDEITLISEKSLEEAWNSKEDERWDEFYKK